MLGQGSAYSCHDGGIPGEGAVGIDIQAEKRKSQEGQAGDRDEQIEMREFAKSMEACIPMQDECRNEDHDKDGKVHAYAETDHGDACDKAEEIEAQKKIFHAAL